jgi:hypothetical protein
MRSCCPLSTCAHPLLCPAVAGQRVFCNTAVPTRTGLTIRKSALVRVGLHQAPPRYVTPLWRASILSLLPRILRHVTRSRLAALDTSQLAWATVLAWRMKFSRLTLIVRKKLLYATGMAPDKSCSLDPRDLPLGIGR